MKKPEKMCNLITSCLKKLCVVFILCFFAGQVSAQSTAGEIETLLSSSSITYAQAARFILEASDVMATSNTEEAFRYAQERNWMPKNVSSNQTARLDGVALIFMKAFDIKGGLIYSNAPRPHYAYRELVHKNIIQGRTDPQMNASGEMLLFITSRILAERERGAL